MEVEFDALDSENEDEADKGSPPDLCVVFLIGGVDEFLNEGLGRGELVMVEADFGHEEGVKAVDGLEFEVEVVVLADGCFQVD